MTKPIDSAALRLEIDRRLGGTRHMSAKSLSARILVVDDEPDLEALIVQKFRKQIRRARLAFLFAHDGVEALIGARWRTAASIMVLSDINMPRMDGLSLLPSSRRRRRSSRR